MGPKRIGNPDQTKILTRSNGPLLMTDKFCMQLLLIYFLNSSHILCNTKRAIFAPHVPDLVTIKENCNDNALSDPRSRPSLWEDGP